MHEALGDVLDRFAGEVFNANGTDGHGDSTEALRSVAGGSRKGMSDIGDKLRDLLAKHRVMTGAQLASRQQERERRCQAGELEVEKVVPGEIVGEPDNRFFLVREDFPLETRQGEVALGAVLDAIPEHIALSACDAELEVFDPATALFMDTETTGLAGGSGTVAFLVGVGYFVEGVFRLEQCFMRDYDEEEPMLRYLDGLFLRCETVVSYNGKSFDMPLLRTRFIQNRLPFRLDGALHFDLVHAARRFWKKRLGDCSLSNVERAVLGVERHGDIPSSEIPQLWFDYLRTRDATELQRVFYHHKMDVLSLVSLTALLSKRIEASDGEGFQHAEDRLSLARLYFRQKQFENVVAHVGGLLETETEPVIRRECLELMAYARKRLDEWQRMEDAWTAVLREFPRNLAARAELAKFYEHRKRDLPAAKRICEETIQFLETRAALGQDADLDLDHAESFRYRLNRIQRKLSRAYGGGDDFPPEDE